MTDMADIGMGGTITADRPMYQTGEPQYLVGGTQGQYVPQDTTPPKVDIWEQARRKDDIGEGSVGLKNLERYRAAVEDSMLQPVISVRAAADVVLGRLGWDENRLPLVEQQIMLDHPGGMMSPAEFLQEIASRPIVITFATVAPGLSARAAAGDEGAAEALEQLRVTAMTAVEQRTQRTMQDTQDVISTIGGQDINQDVAPPELMVGGTDKRRDVSNQLQLLRQVVAMHGPRGEYAPYAERTYAENAEVAKDPRLADRNTTQDFYLTEEGAQNHRALRVAELWSAADPEYMPGQGVSQVARFAAGVLGPPINYARGVVTSPEEYQANFRPLEDMGQMMTDNGKYGYAADLYEKSGEGNQFEQRMMYAADGTPKYYTYDPTNFMGIGTMMDSPTFWYGRAYNNTAPIREAALHIGNDIEMGNGGTANLAKLMRQIRGQGKRVTPLVPDNMKPEQHQAITSQLLDADDRMSGVLSATWGPKMSDLMGQDKREYMSPFMTALIEAPAESLSDPLNLIGNVGRGALTGMVKSAAKNAGRSALGQAARATMGTVQGVAKAPLYVWDDIGEELAEAAPFGGAIGGMSFFQPEQYNMLMGTADPNEEGFDERVEEAHIQARMDQIDAARKYGAAMGIPTERQKRKPEGMIEPPIPQFR